MHKILNSLQSSNACSTSHTHTYAQKLRIPRIRFKRYDYVFRVELKNSLEINRIAEVDKNFAYSVDGYAIWQTRTFNYCSVTKTVDQWLEWMIFQLCRPNVSDDHKSAFVVNRINHHCVFVIGVPVCTPQWLLWYVVQCQPCESAEKEIITHANSCECWDVGWLNHTTKKSYQQHEPANDIYSLKWATNLRTFIPYQWIVIWCH